ncbi:hypothetical protein FHT92_003864 [Rhizobium sp. BK377]|nr:hypothetical protein [Rhizobium sp. BK377]
MHEVADGRQLRYRLLFLSQYVEINRQSLLVQGDERRPEIQYLFVGCRGCVANAGNQFPQIEIGKMISCLVPQEPCKLLSAALLIRRTIQVGEHHQGLDRVAHRRAQVVCQSQLAKGLEVKHESSQAPVSE